MSSRASAPPPPPKPEPGLVQELLAERRQLTVELERARLELREIRAGVGRPDPRLRSLEDENRRLREQLAAAREERDALREGVESALAEIKRASR